MNGTKMKAIKITDILNKLFIFISPLPYLSWNNNAIIAKPEPGGKSPKMTSLRGVKAEVVINRAFPPPSAVLSIRAKQNTFMVPQSAQSVRGNIFMQPSAIIRLACHSCLLPLLCFFSLPLSQFFLWK
jgi:hypothetical protein